MYKDNYYAIIMAGGIGTRLWPISTPECPKQFHDFLNIGKTLLQTTFERVSKFIKLENIYVSTNEKYINLVTKQIPIKLDNIVIEKISKNTAPCILISALHIKKINPNAVMLITPSDHWIGDNLTYINDLESMMDYCENKNVLLTLGIKCTRPHIGYGYIKYNNLIKQNEIKKIEFFKEKPDIETAKKYLSEGNYLWNSGIFAWNITSIINAFETYQSNMFKHINEYIDLLNLNNENKTLEISKIYENIENISIDYAIMEKANNIYVLLSCIQWDDLGTWESVNFYRSLYNKTNV